MLSLRGGLARDESDPDQGLGRVQGLQFFRPQALHSVSQVRAEGAGVLRAEHQPDVGAHVAQEQPLGWTDRPGESPGAALAAHHRVHDGVLFGQHRLRHIDPEFAVDHGLTSGSGSPGQEPEQQAQQTCGNQKSRVQCRSATVRRRAVLRPRATHGTTRRAPLRSHGARNTRGMRPSCGREARTAVAKEPRATGCGASPRNWRGPHADSTPGEPTAGRVRETASR